MNTPEDLIVQMNIMAKALPALVAADAVMVFHPSLPATIRVHERDCPEPKSICQSISNLWQRTPGQTEDTYECVEFPVKLVYQKTRMVPQVIREEVCFQN